MEKSILTPTQKYAAAALFAQALHQSQIHQTRPSNHLFSLDEEPIGGVSAGNFVSVSDDPQLWIHENSGLLLPVFRLLGVDDRAWGGLKETAGNSSQVRHHVESFLAIMSETSDGSSSERMGEELALSKTIGATALSMQNLAISSEEIDRSKEYETKCHEKYSSDEKKTISSKVPETHETMERINNKIPVGEKSRHESGNGISEDAMEEGKLLSYQRKLSVLFELISACIANTAGDDNAYSQPGKGYDARHRVALRLLATWLSIEWAEMEAMEIMAAYTRMTSVGEEDVKEDKNRIPESHWSNWKRGGIIGAAAITGGTLMAITGGLAAPAIAQGLGALAPTLGSIVPAIGASGFAAAASATGSAAGSIAVAASFGAAGAGLTGTKMARRIGDVDEFEFKEIGKNHNQGRLAVGILISGFVLEEEDFIRPWEGHNDNLERYALRWESKNLIAMSTAVQDWITSRIAMKLMKEGAMLTVLNSLLAALTLPATILTAIDLIDGTWAVAIDRSDKVGKLLAEVLLKGLQGNRPVTLIGFSLGARVIFKCLQCLAETKGSNAGLVERVVLLGAPVSIENENWEDVRKMVAGRFINAYSTNDWILGVAFRASLLSQGLAGIQPIDIPGIENVDVTQFIEGHSSYLWTMKQILEKLELESYYPVFRTTNSEPQQENNSGT